MSDTVVKVKIISEGEDFSHISNFVNQIQVPGYSLMIEHHTEFEFLADEIIIISVKNIHSPVMNKAAALRDSLSKAIFIINKNDAILVSSIAKLGYNDIFVLPYETYKLISFLKDLITTGGFRTFDPVQKPEIYDLTALIGSSHRFRKIIEHAKKVSEKKDIDVLILGETGTGKGMLAHAIHNFSKENGPFVDIVCTAIPEALMESELFGYEPGAFTNAKTKKLGLFEVAENGTVFLDEIGDLTANLQAKLLRVIEKKIIRRLGGITDIPINARIISATNRDLDKMVENNIFRRDLYHRLNVVSIELPPLRNRKEDIIPLAEYFIKEFNMLFNKKIYSMSDDLIDFLLKYTWPGNIREFKNAFERAIVFCEDSTTLSLKHFNHFFEEDFIVSPEIKENFPLLPEFVRIDVNYLQSNLKAIDRIYALKVLDKVGGNKSRAAKILGVSRPKLDSLLSND